MLCSTSCIRRNCDPPSRASPLASSRPLSATAPARCRRTPPGRFRKARAYRPPPAPRSVASGTRSAPGSLPAARTLTRCRPHRPRPACCRLCSPSATGGTIFPACRPPPPASPVRRASAATAPIPDRVRAREIPASPAKCTFASGSASHSSPSTRQRSTSRADDCMYSARATTKYTITWAGNARGLTLDRSVERNTSSIRSGGKVLAITPRLI